MLSDRNSRHYHFNIIEQRRIQGFRIHIRRKDYQPLSIFSKRPYLLVHESLAYDSDLDLSIWLSEYIL